MAKVKHGITSSQKPEIKRQLALRDGCHCYICQEPLILVKATIDHFDNDGGPHYNSINNLRLACEECNSRKSLFENLIQPHKSISDKSVKKLCKGYSYFNHVLSRSHH